MERFGPILFLFTLLGSFALASEGEALAEYRFAVKSGSTLKIESFTGAIKVTPSSRAHEIVVVVQGEATGGGPGDAERWLKDVIVQAALKGRTVSIEVSHRGGSVILDLGSRPTGTVSLEIQVPVQTNLDLVTGSGSIDVGHDLEGSVRARSNIGTLFFGRIYGSIDARVDDGSITVSRAAGVVNLRTLRGDINVGTLHDRATLETSSGNISIFSAQRRVTAKASAGDIIASLSAELAETAILSTSGGNIRVTIDPASNMDLLARSSWGRVTTRLPIMTTSGGPGQRHLEGSLNAGGARVKLTASGGNVVLASLPADGT